MTALRKLLPELNAQGNLMPLQLADVDGESKIIEQLAVHAEKISEAFDQGRAEGEANAKLQNVAQLEKIEKDWELKIQLARESWDEVHGYQVADIVLSTMDRFKTEMDKVLHDAVVPFVENSIAKSALVQIEKLLCGILDTNKLVVVQASGPPKMVEKIAERLSLRGTKVIVTVCETPELQIEIDDHLLTTRVNDWLELVRNAGPN